VYVIADTEISEADKKSVKSQQKP
jgi:hypothetical protein